MGLHMVTFGLLIIGGLNWGLVIWGVDVATWGLPSGLVNTVYGLIGLSAVYEVLTHAKRCKECKGEM